MATVKELLESKSGPVLSISADATVLDAALLMNEHKIGCLVVTAQDKVEGIFSERDVLSRVVSQRRDPAVTRVGDVMTRQVVCCTPDTPDEAVRATFKNRRIRHLPVVDEDRRLIGMISIGDLNAYHAHAQEAHIHFLREYIYGRT